MAGMNIHEPGDFSGPGLSGDNSASRAVPGSCHFPPKTFKAMHEGCLVLEGDSTERREKLTCLSVTREGSPAPAPLWDLGFSFPDFSVLKKYQSLILGPQSQRSLIKEVQSETQDSDF